MPLEGPDQLIRGVAFLATATRKFDVSPIQIDFFSASLYTPAMKILLTSLLLWLALVQSARTVGLNISMIPRTLVGPPPR